MLLLSRVSAIFRDPKSGQPLFTIPPHDITAILEAPETIRLDPLFAMLCADGSLEVITRESQKKGLELDPLAGTDPTGKKLTKPTAARKTSAKAEAPAESTDPDTSAEKPE